MASKIQRQRQPRQARSTETAHAAATADSEIEDEIEREDSEEEEIEDEIEREDSEEDLARYARKQEASDRLARRWGIDASFQALKAAYENGFDAPVYSRNSLAVKAWLHEIGARQNIARLKSHLRSANALKLPEQGRLRKLDIAQTFGESIAVEELDRALRVQTALRDLIEAIEALPRESWSGAETPAPRPGAIVSAVKAVLSKRSLPAPRAVDLADLETLLLRSVDGDRDDRAEKWKKALSRQKKGRSSS